MFLGERHLQERQQMLKHQLKATFLMQKHQMHWRHEKETEQLRKYQAKKMTDFEKELDAQRRLMPKVGWQSYAISALSLCQETEARLYGPPKRLQEVSRFI